MVDLMLQPGNGVDYWARISQMHLDKIVAMVIPILSNTEQQVWQH